MDWHEGSQADAQAIHAVVAQWLEASMADDQPRLSRLMAEDVVFLTPGRPPMRGREAFMASARAGQGQYRIAATGKVQEVQVNGDWAYCWSQRVVTVTRWRPGRLLDVVARP